MDDQEMVLKLKKKLKEAIEAGREEDYVLKVLSRLSRVPMTITILQNTQIGKDVNGLRRMTGRIKAESKSLVQSWKQLLPSTEADTTSQHNHRTSSSAYHPSPQTTIGGCHGDNSHHNEPKHHKSSSKRKKVSKTDSVRDADESMDGFSRALLGEKDAQSSEGSVDYLTKDFPAIAGEGSQTTHRVSHIPKHTDKQSVKNARSISPNPINLSYDMPTQSSSEKSTQKESSSTNSRKRKADVVGSLDAVALSKRSRTQVYSGKRTLSGPQFVPSLFDMCIRVLIDNIDVIEGVGGIPFFVLEPVLSKCTANQLLRLEEYNQHFIEDSDGLWEKHCRKEFKGAKPNGHQTWRELYIDKLEHRELKLKSLTARISATERARQEPIRKVISTVATRQPGRRGMRSVPGFFPGRSSAPLDSKSRTKPLMKQTMKMAQQRNHMMRFKPGR